MSRSGFTIIFISFKLLLLFFFSTVHLNKFHSFLSFTASQSVFFVFQNCERRHSFYSPVFSSFQFPAHNLQQKRQHLCNFPHLIIIILVMTWNVKWNEWKVEVGGSCCFLDLCRVWFRLRSTSTLFEVWTCLLSILFPFLERLRHIYCYFS